MQRGSLIDILFERSISQQPSQPTTQSCHRSHRGNNSEQRHHYSSCSHHYQQINKGIKITQFNSSLFVGDDKMIIRKDRTVRPSNNQSPSSPQKQFTIKKMTEFKGKIIASAQRTVQLQLKKKQQQQLQINLKPSTAKNNKTNTSAQNRTTKCNVNGQLPSNDYGCNVREQVVRDSEDLRAFKAVVGEGQGMQRVIEYSKDVLAQTNQSMKQWQRQEQCYGSLKNIGCQLLSPIPLRTKVYSPRKLHSRHYMQQKKYQQNLQREKRQLIQLKRQLTKNYSRPFNPPQSISAQSYIIYQTDLKKIHYNPKMLIRSKQWQQIESRKILLHSHKVVVASNHRNAVQIASLTKIMTCILVIQIGERFKRQLSEEEVIIGMFEQNINGTSACIRKGEIYTVEQLLYGLMLPSGNDASLALAVWAGKLLLKQENNVPDIQGKSYNKRECYARFILQMNSRARQLNMQKTRYANSHGLANIDNRSCPYDLAILCEHALNNPIFRTIVSTQTYQTQIKMQTAEVEPGKMSNQSCKLEKIGGCNMKMQKKESLYDPSQGLLQIEEMKDEGIEDQANQEEEEAGEQLQQNSAFVKQVRWQNSHLLLQGKPELYVGIKTGVTNTAGPCLASCVQYKGRRFIIVVLNSKTMKYRFKDTQNLRKWLFNREGIKYVEVKAEAKQEEV